MKKHIERLSDPRTDVTAYIANKMNINNPKVLLLITLYLSNVVILYTSNHTLPLQ